MQWIQIDTSLQKAEFLSETIQGYVIMSNPQPAKIILFSDVDIAKKIREIAIEQSRVTGISIEDIEDTIRRVMSNEHESPSIQSMIHAVYEQKEWESKDIKSYRDLEYKHKRRVR